MSNQHERAGLDTLDSNFTPSATLLEQLELNRPFIEQMLAKPESEATPDQEGIDND